MHRSIAGSFEQSASVREAGKSATPRDTIAAISTPAGEGAIGLIRISGEDAIGVADRIYRGPQLRQAVADYGPWTIEIVERPPGVKGFQLLPRRWVVERTFAWLGRIVEADRLIDQVMLSVHRAPASYTGEDLVEISCHGGILVTARVLEACFHAGARSARPGEFCSASYFLSPSSPL